MSTPGKGRSWSKRSDAGEGYRARHTQRVASTHEHQSRWRVSGNEARYPSDEDKRGGSIVNLSSKVRHRNGARDRRRLYRSVREVRTCALLRQGVHSTSVRVEAPGPRPA